jgi:hypothetical protein
MPNNRIFWAIESFSIAPNDSTAYVTVHGLQSVGITTTFNLEQVFEIGQLEIYQNIENIPDVEVTMQKVLDGYPLIYHLATRGAPNSTLAGRSNQKCMVLMNIYGDTQNSASGVPISEVVMSGMYISSVTYTAPVEGNCTEDVTVVGNNKEWRSGGYLVTGNSVPFDNTDQPLAYGSGWGGVQRRQNVIFDVNSISSPNGTLLPAGSYGGVDGISTSGTNDKTGGVYGAHVQNITVRADLGREPLYELGRKGPYFRFVNFPVEVATDIEIYCLRGDQVSATETGVVPGSGINLTDKKIYIKLQDGTTIDCGSRNKLQTVSYGGADAGGGNATCTYSYVGYNNFTVTHPQDPG